MSFEAAGRAGRSAGPSPGSGAPARRPARRRWRHVLLGVAAVLAVAREGRAQEILQAQLLDLTILEVQVIVTGARPSDEIECLLRDAAGQVRVAGARPVQAGTAAGALTVVSVSLPLLAPTEREFAVTLTRADRELDRTPWRPLFRAP